MDVLLIRQSSLIKKNHIRNRYRCGISAKYPANLLCFDVWLSIYFYHLVPEQKHLCCVFF